MPQGYALSSTCGVISMMMLSRDAIYPPGPKADAAASSMPELWFLQVFLEPVDVVEAVGDVGLLHQVGEQRDGRLDAFDHELGQTALQPHQALVAVLAVHDELADQAVVVGRDAVALVGAAVHSDAEPAGGMPVGDGAGRRPEGPGVLGIDAALDGVAREDHLVLRERQRCAGGDAD